MWRLVDDMLVRPVINDAEVHFFFPTWKRELGILHWSRYMPKVKHETSNVALLLRAFQNLPSIYLVPQNLFDATAPCSPDRPVIFHQLSSHSTSNQCQLLYRIVSGRIRSYHIRSYHVMDMDLCVKL